MNQDLDVRTPAAEKTSPLQRREISQPRRKWLWPWKLMERFKSLTATIYLIVSVNHRIPLDNGSTLFSSRVERSKAWSEIHRV